MNKKTAMRGLELALLVGLAILFAFCTALERQQQSISDTLIRLHVVANSDQKSDQAMKLLVRDAVLEQAQIVLEQADSKEDAKFLLSQNLNFLEQTANEVLRENGSTQRAAVTLQRELFGTRDYESFSLPGGYYDALRVSIGSGGGHNWWCVVYPQICTAATSEERDAVAVMGGMDQEDLAILEGETPEYQLKFRMIELLEDLLGWFRSGKDGIPVSG